MKTVIETDKNAPPGGHYSQALAVDCRGRLLFVSGMTPRAADGAIVGIGDIEAQTRRVLEQIKAAVEAAGGGMENVVRVDVYLRNIEHGAVVNKVRADYFPSPAPVSTMVEVAKFVSPEDLVEITAIAVI